MISPWIIIKRLDVNDPFPERKCKRILFVNFQDSFLFFLFRYTINPKCFRCSALSDLIFLNLI